MQLDRTRIAVRERSNLDTLDLSLHVLRAYAKPLLATMALGVVPLMLVNYLLIGWMLRDPSSEVEFPVRFLWHLSVLVYLQAPLASVFATAYVGQAVFQDRPGLREVARGVFRLLPRVAWCQLVVRGVGAAWLLLLSVERFAELDPMLEIVAPLLLLLWASALRAFRPFVNEIVLLERNPLVSRDRQVLTVGRRSRMLHAAAGGDLVGRWLGASVAGVLLALATYMTLLFCSGVLWNDWKQGPLMLGLGYPAALWVTAMYMTVFRFLSYLDLRIRQEGWEVELRVRAEAVRLAGRLA